MGSMLCTESGAFCIANALPILLSSKKGDLTIFKSIQVTFQILFFLPEGDLKGLKGGSLTLDGVWSVAWPLLHTLRG